MSESTIRMPDAAPARPPRVRFTVRGLMIAVAVAAGLCGVEVWIRARQRWLSGPAAAHRTAAEAAEAAAPGGYRLLRGAGRDLSREERGDPEDRVAAQLDPDPASPGRRAPRLARYHREL